MPKHKLKLAPSRYAQSTPNTIISFIQIKGYVGAYLYVVSNYWFIQKMYINHVITFPINGKSMKGCLEEMFVVDVFGLMVMIVPGLHYDNKLSKFGKRMQCLVISDIRPNIF